MSNEPSSMISKWRLARLVFVLAGIFFGQAVLYGPSLVGQKILLPLDILASPNIYLPRTAATAQIQPHNYILSDLIFQCEPQRRFAMAEYRAGRVPMWTPYQFGGSPYFWPKFSPFLALQCCWESPVVLAWVQLLTACIAGVGMYAFARRVLTVSPWPATFAAWCYPLTGYFVLWQGAPPAQSVYWLPWLLLVVNATVRRTSAFAPIGLSVMTGLVLISGALDGAAQVLLISGCFALWCWLDEHRREWLSRAARRAAVMLTIGWSLGFFIASPYVLPYLEYAQTGARMGKRVAGSEERAPVGLAALPQVVLPRIHGSSEQGSLPLFPKNQGSLNESSAAAYTGMIATLLVAPLAFGSRRHRSINLFLILLAGFGLSWCLNVPGVVQLLRLPGLNMMSHNRLVFAAAFAVIALVAVGLEVLWQKRFIWRWWSWVPLTLLGVLCGWCAYRAIVLPEPIRTELGVGIAAGKQTKWVHDLAGVAIVQAWYRRAYAVAAILSGLGAAGWLLLWRQKNFSTWGVGLLAALLLGDLFWFGYGRSAQCDPALYFPRIPVLEQIEKSTPGRIIGYGCLPALLGTTHNLRDIRGYDGVDPARLMDLLALTADARTPSYAYAYAQALTPRAGPTAEGGIQLSPVLDMLNVRYVIFRGSPNPTDRPVFQGPDYWVLENRSALERAFIPQRVEVEADEQIRLAKLAASDFDPRAVAYVEAPVGLPAAVRGTATIVAEIPTRVSLAVNMETPGLVVLADLWNQGWRAYLNGQRQPILRVNHAIRGVVTPAGVGTLEFRYEPASFAWGLKLAGLAAVILLGWSWTAFRHQQRSLSTRDRTIPQPGL